MAVPPKAVIDSTAAETPQFPDDPMNEQQADILRVLCENAGEPFDAGLTQEQAHERIELLRKHLNENQNL